jgi:hypothetical protein
MKTLAQLTKGKRKPLPRVYFPDGVEGSRGLILARDGKALMTPKSTVAA